MKRDECPNADECINRDACLIAVSKRILVFSSIVLIIAIILTSLSSYYYKKFAMVPFLFTCGLLGGFVSIQQRLKRIGTIELQLLSKSWAQVMVIPVFGGIFALVLYVLFLSNLLSGDLFPSFYIPPFDIKQPNADDIIKFFKETTPETGIDFSKLIFWAFVAGFSERLVPQIIHSMSDKVDQKTNKD